MKIEISLLDSQRFDIKVAKAVEFNAADLGDIEAYCISNDIDLLIARVSTNEISVAQDLEKLGHRLMDTLVYYKFDYAKKPAPQNVTPFVIRNVSGNIDYALEVSSVAGEAFAGYFGHYHADSKLDRKVSDSIYSDWAYRSTIDSSVANAVLGAFIEDKITGFITLRINSEGYGELALNGVSPVFQKRGLYRALVLSGMEWLHQSGLDQIFVSTQINNISVQKVWTRLGFEMDHSFYTFHKWFK